MDEKAKAGLQRVLLRSANAEAEVILNGGCLGLYRLTAGGRVIDILRPAPAESGDAPRPTDTAMFPLVPYSNRIRDGVFTFAGRTFTLESASDGRGHSIHGVGWQSPWQLEHHANDRVDIALEHIADRRWPFSFRAIQSFRLTGTSLTCTLQLTNTDSQPMPAGLGFHPYFPRRATARLNASPQRVWRADADRLPLELADFDDASRWSSGIAMADIACDDVFEQWNGRATIEWPAERLRLELEADDTLERLVVFSPPGEDYFCIEPVSNATDAFNLTAQGAPIDRTGMRILEPGEAWAVRMRLRPTIR